MDRGVFQKQTREEINAYKDPLNYITIMEAYKNELFLTTPLKVCKNNSMNQLPPSGVSLNYCLKQTPCANCPVHGDAWNERV
jgi:hypothetical protein